MSLISDYTLFYKSTFSFKLLKHLIFNMLWEKYWGTYSPLTCIFFKTNKQNPKFLILVINTRREEDESVWTVRGTKEQKIKCVYA